MVPRQAAAASENWLEMPILGSRPIQNLWGWGPAICVGISTGGEIKFETTALSDAVWGQFETISWGMKMPLE